MPRQGRALRASATVILFAAAVGGCSSTRSTATADASWPGSTDAYRVAYEPPPPKVEMEDDGMEAQVPPLKRERTEPDDPREPFSRNYGTAVPVRRAEAPVAPGAVAPAFPLAFRSRMTLASGD
ncbi:MAG: hypothetical protein AB1749_04390 [Pseudomonadota bacterium]